MEVSVLVQQTPGNGFRAWCGGPIPAAAEGATREEALAKLRADLEARTRGAELVRLTIGTTGPVVSGPDGNLWFLGDGFVGRMDLGGNVTRFPAPVGAGS